MTMVKLTGATTAPAALLERVTAYSLGVPARGVVTALLLGVLLLSATLVAVYVLGQRACPPPEWAFWRYTEGPNGTQNFACVAG